jgi:hypothetical protein
VGSYRSRTVTSTRRTERGAEKESNGKQGHASRSVFGFVVCADLLGQEFLLERTGEF